MTEQLNQLEDDNSGLSRIWNEQHDRAVIGRLMEVVRPRFAPKTWAAFERQIFDGQKPAQLAAELEMSIGAVYMARTRILAALRSEAEGLVDTF